jgi:hypothetical protein
MMIDDFLYGAQDGFDIEACMDDFTRYATLKKWSSGQWTDLLNKWAPTGFIWSRAFLM